MTSTTLFQRNTSTPWKVKWNWWTFTIFGESATIISFVIYSATFFKTRDRAVCWERSNLGSSQHCTDLKGHKSKVLPAGPSQLQAEAIFLGFERMLLTPCCVSMVLERKTNLVLLVFEGCTLDESGLFSATESQRETNPMSPWQKFHWPHWLWL